MTSLMISFYRRPADTGTETAYVKTIYKTAKASLSGDHTAAFLSGAFL
ncbi:hypothetical protein QW060_24985 [Myroides ceti]|uniref:Uncharacterized protein n=1 Tax=Paenimyroides ceti TaxID=395087 RepID=A0ABT8D2K5_9FLAO|nr:hypothetical protein [Paenimyroides ceti]MDN3710136.1 hypothetical protein [Paenimyroides ceti]